MSDVQNSLPAGGESAPAVSSAQPQQSSDPTSILDAYWEGDPGEPADASAEDDVRAAAEPAEIATAPEPEGEEGADDQPVDDSLEAPEDDASETEPTEPDPKDDETGTRMHRLRDGSEVSLGDLKKGYGEAREFRERVMPQVQQRLAQAEQERQAIAAERQQFQRTQAEYAALLQQAIPPEVTDEEFRNDPIGAMERERERNKAIVRLQETNRQRQAIEERQRVEATRSRQAYMQQETQRLAEAIPDLRDPVKAKAFHDDYQTVGKLVGFTPQEMGQVYDHRLFRLAQYAIKGMKAEQAEKQTAATTVQKAKIAAQKVAKAPPVQAPAARQSAAAREGMSARGALEKLSKSGRTQDADDFLSRFA